MTSHLVQLHYYEKLSESEIDLKTQKKRDFLCACHCVFTFVTFRPALSFSLLSPIRKMYYQLCCVFPVSFYVYTYMFHSILSDYIKVGKAFVMLINLLKQHNNGFKYWYNLLL